MDFGSSSWHVISTALVFVFGALMSIKICKVFNTASKRSLTLYLWHTLFSFVYLFYIQGKSADALGYYKYSLQTDSDFSFGTDAVVYITSFFSSGLNLSIAGTFLVFSQFGFIGLLAFDAALQFGVREKAKKVRRFATLIVFLPSVSFWSSAIGKDAISFMASGLALWAVLDLRNRAWMLAVAIASMMIVRPHMAALMVIATAVSMVIQSRVSLVQRIFLGGLSAFAAAAILPFAMNYAGLGSDSDIAGLIAYIELHQGYNMEGGGGIDISSMPLPMQLFTYLFRPLPFEAFSIPALAASIDNMILLYLFAFGGAKLIRRQRVNGAENIAFMWIFSISAWLVLATTSANLGISLRQKWMFAPMLIYLLLTMIGRSKRPVTRNNQILETTSIESRHEIR